MIYRIGVIFSFLLSTCANAEGCKVKYLEELEYTDIECQFYMGTAAYRNKVYSVAAAHWNYVIDSPVMNEGEESIKAMALGTVTFLTYHGLGTKQDRNKAVKNWKDAVAEGNLEARRHLGFAYSDDDFKNKNLVNALGWYESIFLLYPTANEVEESDLTIYEDALKDADKIKNLLSEKQRNAALSFAKSTLN